MLGELLIACLNEEHKNRPSDLNCNSRYLLPEAAAARSWLAAHTTGKGGMVQAVSIDC